MEDQKVVLWVVLGGAAEVHEKRSVSEELPLGQRQLAHFSAAEPEVVLRGYLAVAQAEHDGPEGLRASVVLMVFGRFRLLDLSHSVDCCKDDGLVELVASGQPHVGQSCVFLLAAVDVVSFGGFVVDLFLEHCLTLCRVADADAADATQRFVRRFALPKS